ncbi:pyridoxal-phosphate dependent enzyme, partial [Staphylococcus aureus]|uniref:pyridoxal-phosphate dependent enzyme n=1 Tax=Staphylococcus aureus TaxID=1280 RepID=UPI003D22F60C
MLQGESYSDAYNHAAKLQEKHGYTFVHPFDDPEVIAGQGTIAMEILRQHPQPIHAIFCAIGGGGLISGIAAYVKAVRPDIKVIGVQSGLRRDGAFGGCRQTRGTEGRGSVCRRHRRQAGGQGDLPHHARAGRRDHHRGYGCHLRGAQG